MRTKRKSTTGWIYGVIVAGIVWGWGGTGRASLTPSSPQRDVQTAEVVVVGTLDQLEPAPDEAKNKFQWLWQGRLTVKEVVKGQPKSTPLPLWLSVMKPAKATDRPEAPIPLGKTGIWCLKWIEPWQAYLPQPFGPRAVLASSELDQVKQWVAEVSTTPTEPSPTPIQRPRDLGFVWDVKVTDRLVVASVRPVSPAAEGGFRKEDLIKKVEDRPVKTATSFEQEVARYQPGARVKVLVERLCSGCDAQTCKAKHEHHVHKMAVLEDMYFELLLPSDGEAREERNPLGALTEASIRRKANALISTDAALKDHIVLEARLESKHGGLLAKVDFNRVNPEHWLWEVIFQRVGPDGALLVNANGHRVAVTRYFDMRTGQVCGLPTGPGGMRGE